jgi:NADPH:quinone reductase-like Zn-dependent oxidoreductase
LKHFIRKVISIATMSQVTSQPPSAFGNLLTWNKFSLKGRTALITGGARGLGLAFAQGLAEAGADVAIFDVGEPNEAFFEIEKLYGVKINNYK